MTIEELLSQAEQLLAEGQHGECDDKWKRKVRDYFSQHERGEMRSRTRNLASAVRWFLAVHDSGDIERDMQSEWASAVATMRKLTYNL